ncbi:DDE superfamily endonuclease [Hirsutella rhossiliensis]
MFLTHHRIFDPSSPHANERGYREPTIKYIEIVNSFLRYIRRVSRRHKPQVALDAILNSPTRRFGKHRILNLDETPIPFEYLDGYTYEQRGARTIDGKSDRSGWNKRQATLILYIFADGIQRLKPKVIFHGAPPPFGRIMQDEGHLYSPEVTVEFNETAYNNEELFKDWIRDELAPIVSRNDDFLLVMDVASFHKTDDVLHQLRQHKVVTALIPPGCTSLLQPLDTAINRPLKDWLRDATDEYVSEREARGLTMWSIREKRIMTTFVVASAVRTLESRAELVQKAFLNCGISIRPDGTQDIEIRVKDIPAAAIDFTNWEQARDVIVKDEEGVSGLLDEEEIVKQGDEAEDRIDRKKAVLIARLLDADSII